MSYYSEEKCKRIVDSARKLKMYAKPLYYSSLPSELAKIFNGCGPDSWTDGFRRFASWVYRNFEEPVSIHDFDFQFSDGTDEGLKDANERFRKNCKLKLDSIYPLKKVWLYPARAVAWGKIEFAYIALTNGAEEAWQSAHERFSEAC